VLDVGEVGGMKIEDGLGTAEVGGGFLVMVGGLLKLRGRKECPGTLSRSVFISLGFRGAMRNHAAL
jgi:hypothetical protein